jgi:hypothetical protein
MLVPVCQTEINMNTLYSDFAAQLSAAGVFHAVRLMQLDVDAIFGALLHGAPHPYRRYRWFVNMDEFGNRVIHAAPPEEELGWAPWERWRISGDKVVREQWVSEPGRRWRVLDEATDDLMPRYATSASSLREQLLKSRVDVASHVLGIDLDATFITPVSSQFQHIYRQLRWAVIPHWLAGDGPVIYALPPMHKSDVLPWESWYRDGSGKLIHHVHYTIQQPQSQGTWQEGAGSLQRPPEVMGVVWHWYDEPSMTPALAL